MSTGGRTGQANQQHEHTNKQNKGVEDTRVQQYSSTAVMNNFLLIVQINSVRPFPG